MTKIFEWSPLAAVLSLVLAVGGSNIALGQEEGLEADAEADVEADATLESDQPATDEVPATSEDDAQDVAPPQPQEEARDEVASPDEDRSVLQSDDQNLDRQIESQPDQSLQQDRPRDRFQRDRDGRRSDRAEADAEGRFETRERRRDFRQRDLGIRFGDATDRGLAITTLDRNNAFYRGGLRQGDVIVSLDGRPIRGEAEFGRFISRYVDERIPVVVYRDGREETIYITYEWDQAGVEPPYAQQRTDGRPYLGVTFEPGYRDVVVVGSVMPGSPAEQAGLMAGDVLLALNGREIMSPQDVVRMVAEMQVGDPLDIEFSRRVANTTEAVIGSRQVQQAQRRDDPGIRREAGYADPGDEVRQTLREIEDRVVPLIESREGRPLLRDQDGDGRLLDRDRRVLPRRRN